MFAKYLYMQNTLHKAYYTSYIELAINSQFLYHIFIRLVKMLNGFSRFNFPGFSWLVTLEENPTDLFIKPDMQKKSQYVPQCSCEYITFREARKAHLSRTVGSRYVIFSVPIFSWNKVSKRLIHSLKTHIFIHRVSLYLSRWDFSAKNRKALNIAFQSTNMKAKVHF